MTSLSGSVHVPAPAPSAAASPVGFQELELDHLLVADLAVQVLAGELQVLVEPFEHHLRRHGPLLADLAIFGDELLQAGNAEELGLVVRERLLVRHRHRVAVREPADDLAVGALVVLAATATSLPT